MDENKKESGTKWWQTFLTGLLPIVQPYLPPPNDGTTGTGFTSGSNTNSGSSNDNTPDRLQSTEQIIMYSVIALALFTMLFIAIRKTSS
jgi:hypothetical protein